MNNLTKRVEGEKMISDEKREELLKLIEEIIEESHPEWATLAIVSLGHPTGEANGKILISTTEGDDDDDGMGNRAIEWQDFVHYLISGINVKTAKYWAPKFRKLSKEIDEIANGFSKVPKTSPPQTSG